MAVGLELHLSDVARTAVTLQASDSAALGASDTSLLSAGDLALKSVSDSCRVQVLTIPVNQISKSATDTCTLILTEPEATAGGTAVSDSISMSGADVVTSIPDVAPLISISAADTVNTHLTEQATVAPAVPISDAASIQAGDLASTTAILVVTDSLAVALAEPEAAQSFLTVPDSVTVVPADIGLVAGNFSYNVTEIVATQASDASPAFALLQDVAATDAVRAQASDSSPFLSVVASAAETLRCSANDAAALLLKFFAVTDDSGITANESLSIFTSFIQLVASDTTAVDGSDLVAAIDQLLTQLATTDTGLIGLADDLSALTATMGIEDACAVLADDLYLLAATHEVTDAAAFVAQAENSNVISAGVLFVEVFADDSAQLGAGELVEGQSQVGRYAMDDVSIAASEGALTESVALSEIWDAHYGADYATYTADPVSYRLDPNSTW